MRVIAKLRQIRLYREGAKVRFEAIIGRSANVAMLGIEVLKQQVY